VQAFLTFDTAGIDPDTVEQVTLRSDALRLIGTPFEDLGILSADIVEFDRISPALWNREPIGDAYAFSRVSAEKERMENYYHRKK